MFRVINSDCVDLSGNKYPFGEITRFQNISKCELCICGTDSEWICDHYVSCKSLDCKSSNSAVGECCAEMHCGGITKFMILGFGIFAIILYIAFILIIMLIFSILHWRKTSKKADNSDTPDTNLGEETKKQNLELDEDISESNKEPVRYLFAPKDPN
ncbi:hypothetical protein RF11_05637 [Thelohanellus kitauei]|uniref:Uncharacterized protein n=1 Tax=Thelohanellus kitauei TaxID=669202 RepID=A0A0C2J0D5_THEKT|nr:hypothetical protein RF11_05637 [Thelohanellus kitauei]